MTEPLSSVVTPSGTEIQFWAEPKRKYELGYFVVSDGTASKVFTEVPSVTDILNVLDKPGLPWWGMGVGVAGLFELERRGYVVTEEEAIDLLTTEKLTVNHVRDQAGDRGLSVHQAFENWAKTGVKPDLQIYPPEERGYVMGLCEFLDHVDLKLLGCEVMVCSVEHGYAGRYDLLAETREDAQVVIHRTPKRGAQWATLPAGYRLLIDLKTSKGVYPNHMRQLEAYEYASVECGYGQSDARAILHVNADGTYEFIRSTALFEDFLPVLAVWRSNQAMKERKRVKA